MHPLKGREQSSEQIAARVAGRMANGYRRKPHTPESRAKISVALKGKSSAWLWKGDDIGYVRAHERVRATRGNASEHTCASCDTPGAEWAFVHETSAEFIRAQYGKRYSVRAADYMPMCRSCHKTYDRSEVL